MRGDQASGEAHSGGNRDLLSQHSADCQLEAVLGAGNAQATGSAAKSNTRRSRAMMDGKAELRESHRRAERVPVGGLDSDRSLHAIQLHGPRVKVGSDALDTWNGAPAKKRQHGRPVVRGMIAQQKADLATPPCRNVQAARAPQIGGRTTKQRQESFVAADAAEPCGEGDLGHQQMRFVDELLGEQNAAGLGDGDRRRAKMLAKEAPKLPFTYTQATSQGINTSLVQGAELNQRQGARYGIDVPRHEPRSGAVSGRHRRHGRKPASCAAAAVG
jgi:hypothetical protein